MKFGKIPAEDLAMTVYEADTSAAAVVLGDFGELVFEFINGDVKASIEYHQRIKILKRAGFEEGDIVIPFYSKDRMQKVGDIQLIVFASDGSKTELSKKDIFEEKVNDFWSRVRFSAPNLVEGCVIDFKYQLVSDAIFELPDWYFQRDIPVRWSELRLEIPEWYDYIFINQGRPVDILEKDVSDKSFYISGQGNMSLKVNHTRFVMKDVPALKKENYITTMNDYYARVKFQLSSVKYEDGITKQILSTWPAVADELWKDENFGGQLKKKRNYSGAWDAVQPTLANAQTQEEKAKAIYDFVISSLHLEAGGGVYVRGSLDGCFETKAARGHEMNLLLIALLREAGVEAWPMLLSTRDHGQPMPLYPLLDQFNYVIVLAYLDGKQVLLDATNPQRPMGYPDHNALNGMGWVVLEGKPQWMEIQSPSASDTYLMNMALDGNGALHGSVTLSCNGYSAVDEREQLKTQPSGEHLKKRIQDRFIDAQVDSMTFENREDLAKPFKAVVQCHLPDRAQVTGDFLYFSPVLMTAFDENPFKTEQREYPVDFPYPMQERLILNLELPAGYLVEELPEPARVAMPDNSVSFQYQFSQRENSLQLIVSLKIDKLRFEQVEYASLRNFFSIVEEKLGAQVVLKKA